MSIYAKNNGTWVPVGPAITVSAEGTPGAPNILNPEGGPVIKFEAAPEGAAGPNLAHGASISPNDNGEFVTVDQDNLEVAVSGTEPFTDYVVSIYGVNEAGRGDISKTDPFQLNYNDATGGDVVDEYTRLSDNTRWRYHKFTSSDATGLTVAQAIDPFRVLVVGGGGKGMFNDGSVGAGGGSGGQVKENNAMELSVGSHPVTVGALQTTNAARGNSSEFEGINCTGGAGGVNGAAAQGGPGGSGAGGGPAGSTGGVGKASDITGSSYRYAAGGGGGAGYGNPGGADCGGGGAAGQTGGGGGAGTNGGGGGGSARNAHHPPAGHGGAGVVIVAYQIGTSTTRQIQQAQAEEAVRQAEEAARQAGVEQGISQGYSQAQEDLQEELTTLRTQIAGAAGTTDTMLIDGKEQKVTRRGRRK